MRREADAEHFGDSQQRFPAIASSHVQIANLGVFAARLHGEPPQNPTLATTGFAVHVSDSMAASLHERQSGQCFSLPRAAKKPRK
jgi:hypothetical protein